MPTWNVRIDFSPASALSLMSHNFRGKPNRLNSTVSGAWFRLITLFQYTDSDAVVFSRYRAKRLSCTRSCKMGSIWLQRKEEGVALSPSYP